MRDVGEVLNEKEIQLSVVRREVDALRLVAPLLAEESDGVKKPPQSVDQDAITDAPVKKKWPL
jgi:hypothetical protein